MRGQLNKDRINKMTTSKEFSVTFTDGSFSKVVEATSFEHAKSLASNLEQWPMEISEYRDMYVVIHEDGNEVAIYNYDEL